MSDLAIKALEGTAASAQPAGGDAKKLATAAAEFESMLMLQMLREMRKSGSWKDESEESDGYGAETLFGEDLISEKSLDEVILSYLAEDLGERK